MKFHNKRISSNGTTYFQYILENFFGYGEFLPSSALMDMFADLICDEDSLPQMCESIIFLLCGFDSGQANLTLIDTIVHHTPAGSSSKTLVHYAQEMGSGNFNSKCIFLATCRRKMRNIMILPKQPVWQWACRKQDKRVRKRDCILN